MPRLAVPLARCGILAELLEMWSLDVRPKHAGCVDAITQQVPELLEGMAARLVGYGLCAHVCVVMVGIWKELKKHSPAPAALQEVDVLVHFKSAAATISHEAVAAAGALQMGIQTADASSSGSGSGGDASGSGGHLPDQQQRAELAAQLLNGVERVKEGLEQQADAISQLETVGRVTVAQAQSTAQGLRRLVAPAADLAFLLHRFQALPEQRAGAQLNLAKAAAARSCAYLRCSQVECGGGPAAGEGSSSKKCSACRVAYYW